MRNRTRHRRRRLLAILPVILVVALYAGFFVRNIVSPNVSFSPDLKWIIALHEPWSAWDPHTDVYYQPSWLPFLSHRVTWLNRRTSRTHGYQFSWQDTPAIISVWLPDGRPFFVLNRKDGTVGSVKQLLPQLRPPDGCPQHQDLLAYMISKNPYPGDYLLGAVRAADLPRVKRLVEKFGANVTTPIQKNPYIYPLLDAVHTGDKGIVQYLISAGADPNPPDERTFLPLCAAASRGDVPMAKLLLEAGADVNVRANNARPTALHCAADHAHLDMVRFLVSQGIDTAIRATDGRTGLSSAQMFAEAHKKDQYGEGYAAVVAFLEEHTPDTAE